MVKVTYDGDMLTIRKPLEYVLDLNHYKYTHFVTETGLGEIDETLGRLADNLNNYTSTSETTNSVLNEIANAISTGIIIKSQVLVSQSNPDISTKLKEFVLIWTLDYGKRTEKLTKTFLSGLRVRCALLSEGLLKDIVNDGIQEWTNEIKIIIDKMSELGTMNLSFYGPVGWYSSASIFLHDRGNSIENFNNLGDNIVEDIKSVLEIIQSEDIEKKGNQVKKAIVDRVSEQEQFTSQILPPAME